MASLSFFPAIYYGLTLIYRMSTKDEKFTFLYDKDKENFLKNDKKNMKKMMGRFDEIYRKSRRYLTEYKNICNDPFRWGLPPLFWPKCQDFWFFPINLKLHHFNHRQAKNAKKSYFHHLSRHFSKWWLFF